MGYYFIRSQRLMVMTVKTVSSGKHTVSKDTASTKSDCLFVALFAGCVAPDAVNLPPTAGEEGFLQWQR